MGCLGQVRWRMSFLSSLVDMGGHHIQWVRAGMIAGVSAWPSMVAASPDPWTRVRAASPPKHSDEPTVAVMSHPPSTQMAETQETPPPVVSFSPDRPSLSNATGRVPPGAVMAELGTNLSAGTWVGDGLSLRTGLSEGWELRARLPGSGIDAVGGTRVHGAAARLGLKWGRDRLGPVSLSVMPELAFTSGAVTGISTVNISTSVGAWAPFASAHADLGLRQDPRMGGGVGVAYAPSKVSVYGQAGADAGLFAGGGAALLLAPHTQVDMGADVNQQGAVTLHFGMSVQR